MAITVNGPGTPGPRGPEGPTGPSGTLTANTGISIGGTLETQHIVPESADTYDLGNTANYFRNLYIGTGSIYMMSADGKEARLSMDTSGDLTFKKQTRLGLGGQSGKITTISKEGTTGGTGGTGSTGCGSAINFKFGGGTEDSQGFYTKGKFWTVDDANDSGCTFMNFDTLYINNWEDTPCDRNFTYLMNNLPYCGRIDIFPEGFSGENQEWARFFYAGHYGVGGATQTGGISCGYHRFNIDQDQALDSYNNPSGGSAAFITGNEYEVRFYPYCSDGGDGSSGGSGGGSGGVTQEPPTQTYPCIRRNGLPSWEGFTLEGNIAGRKGRWGLGGSGCSSGVSAGAGPGTPAALVNINTISEMYVANNTMFQEGYFNDNPFLSSLNQTGRVTITRSYAGTADTWMRYNYSAHAVSGGTGEDGYVRFTGMTLDTFGPFGATATTVFDTDKTAELCFDDTVGVTCNPNEYIFTYRGLTSTSFLDLHSGSSLPATGDMYLRQIPANYDAGATFGAIDFLILDAYEDSPCYRHMVHNYNALSWHGSVSIFPEDMNMDNMDPTQAWVKYYYDHKQSWQTYSGGGLCSFRMDDYTIGNQVVAYEGASGATAMLVEGKRYVVSFYDEYQQGQDGGNTSGPTANPDAPAYPCTYRYGATQGATAMRDPGAGFFGVSGSSAAYTTLGGGATVVDIRSINEMYIDTYSPNGSGLRYDGDFLDGLDQTGKITLTRLNGGTAELWARFTYDVHGNTLGTGGYHRFQGVTLDTWGPSGGYTSGSYGDYHIPMDRTNTGVVPWKMCFENIAVTGPTASLGTNQFSFNYKSGTSDADPTYGFFKVGTTGAADSLRDGEFLYIDNFEESGEYGTGRFIGDFLDTLDNTGTITVTPFGFTAGQQWVKYYYTTYVQGITSSGGSGGYHKILGISAMNGNYLGNSFGTVSGTSGPFMIEFNDTVGQVDNDLAHISCVESFDNTGMAYGILNKPYPVTIEALRYGRLGTGGGCTGTLYIGAEQSNPISGISGVAFNQNSSTTYYAATAGNTFSAGNTVGANTWLYLNLQGFTLAGSTGCPNYFHGMIQFRRMDGS